jgi:hypothetical protein
MWAHYAVGQAGACLAFDETALAEEFPLAYVGDVAYEEAPARVANEFIDWAYTTGKRRHSLRLLAAARQAAYFKKRLDWQYECERRLVVLPKGLRRAGSAFIASLSARSLRYILIGSKAGHELQELCKRRAAECRIPCFTVHAGKRSYQPFFVKANRGTFRWGTGAFERQAHVCRSCREPAEELANGHCAWCSISPEARMSAPKRSMLAATLHFGIDKGIPLEFTELKPLGRWATESATREQEPSQPKRDEGLPF